MRRILAVAALLAVAGAASAAPQERRYRDPKFGWSLARVPGLRLTVVDARPGMRYSLNGAIVASFAGARTDGKFDRFPPGGVAFGFLHREGGPAPDVDDPEARFPLTRRDFRGGSTRRPAASTFYRHVVANGNEFDAYVWIGRRARTTDRERIWRAVGSLRFPPLRTGTRAGYFWVVKYARAYSVRSVTRLTLANGDGPITLHLVRAPGGFYALGDWSDLERGYKECERRFDRAQFEFFCDNGARWSRMGRVLVNPNPAKFQDDPLDLIQAKVARDGHVLVGGWGATQATARDERRFWPRGR